MQSYSPASIGNPLAAPRLASHVKLHNHEVGAYHPAGSKSKPEHRYGPRQRILGAAAALVIAASGLTYKVLDNAPPQAKVMESAPLPAPPYVKGLLDVIAVSESSGNYNAYLRHPGNNSIIFTSMSVQDVLSWQKRAVNDRNIGGSAIGRYQFINDTLTRLVEQQNIDVNRMFDETLQDELATVLLKEAGLDSYVKSEVTSDEFAHNLSKIWAGIPMVIGPNGDQSYYHGVGPNQATITTEQIMRGIATIE